MEEHTEDMKTNVPGVLDLNSEELDAAESQDTPNVPLTKDEMLVTISKMVDSEQISPAQARHMRFQMGIYQSDFTKKKLDKKKSRKRNKIAKKSRKANRKSK